MRNRQGGFILITVYLMLAFLLVPAAVLFARSLGHLRSSQRLQNLMQTQYLAEAALDRAIVSLRDPVFLAGVSDSASDPEIAYTALGSGGYEVDVDPIAGRPGIYRVQAVGYYPARQSNSPGFVNRTLESYTRVTPAGPPSAGILGDLSVNLNGSLRVDSYDSRQPGGVRSTGRGVVGSNGVLSNSIRINGSTQVFGDVLSGPGSGADTIQITGSSMVTGQVGAAPARFDLPPVTEPAGNTELRINGHQTVTLPGGVHHYSRITVSGGGRLSFTGPAVVYTGDLTLNGNAVTTAGNLPPNLTFRVAGAGQVTLNGNTSFYGAIYAPESSVTLNGNNRLFGSVVGKRLTGNGSAEIWYDEALDTGDSGGNSNSVQVVSWSDPL